MPGCGDDIGDSAGDGIAENGSKAFFGIVTHCCRPLVFQMDAETATGKDDRLLFTVNIDIKRGNVFRVCVCRLRWPGDMPASLVIGKAVRRKAEANLVECTMADG